MLGVEQKQHQRIGARGAEGRRIGAVGCDLQALELEDRIECLDGRRDRDEDDHRPRHALVHMLEQDVDGQGQEEVWE